MNFFNRREVFVSTSFEQASTMRAKIQSDHVECQMVCKDLNRPDRGFSYGSLSYRLKEYRLYVHKKDVESAVSLMNRPGF